MRNKFVQIENWSNSLSATHSPDECPCERESMRLSACIKIHYNKVLINNVFSPSFSCVLCTTAININ